MRHGVVIAVGNHKGGVGKTTNALHIGAALGERGHQVLIVDCDPGANSTKHLGLAEKGYAGSFEFMVRDEPDPVGLAVTEGMPKNVSIIPSRSELAEVTNHVSKFTLNVLKRPIDAARQYYDYIILDTPPNPKFITTLASYLAADWFLLSAFPDTLSLYGLTESLADIADVRAESNPDLEVLGVVVSNVDRRTKAWEDVLKLVQQNFPGRDFQTFISRAQAVQECASRGKTLFQMKKYLKHPVTQQYRELAAEIEARTLNRDEFLSGGQLALKVPEAATPAMAANQ